MIAARSSRPRFASTMRILASAALAATTTVWPLLAHAEEPTEYCQRITARAEADAALLLAPTARLQLIRFPSTSSADSLGVTGGASRDVQPRAALSIGFVDMYRGLGVLDVARADCLRQQNATSLEMVVLQRADIGRLKALEQKLAFLREQASTVDQIVKNAEDRFAAHATTLAEVQDIRIHALALARLSAQAEQEVAALKARNVPMPAEPLTDILLAYEQHAVEVERRVAHVQKLQPWNLGVTGGVAATPKADVFAVAELSYNFGGLFQVGAQNRAVDARAKELKNARYELRHQIETVVRELRSSAEQSRRQARLLEGELARMVQVLKSLEGAEAPNKPTIVAAVTLQMIDVEAEQRFLTALAEAQSSVGGAK